MNNIIKAIATAMIIILIAVLIWVFLSYFKENEIIDSISSTFRSGDFSVSTLDIPSGNSVNEKNDNYTVNNGLIESIINNSPEYTESGSKEIYSNSEDKVISDDIGNDIKSGDENVSGEINNNIQNNNTPAENKSGEKLPNAIIEIPEDEANQILITSDSQTSNQQKQEILTEIDKALQGLLEAVGKVEVVDEERLNATLNSEVDES